MRGNEWKDRDSEWTTWGRFRKGHGSVGRVAVSGCPAELGPDYGDTVDSCTWPFVLGSLFFSSVLLPSHFLRAHMPCFAVCIASLERGLRGLADIPIAQWIPVSISDSREEECCP